MHFIKRLLKYIGKLFIAFLLILAFMWFLMWSENRRDSRLADEIINPLEELMASKYSLDDFSIDYIGCEEDQIYLIYIKVSREVQYSDTFLEKCHEVVKLVSKYVEQHPKQFALNTEHEFELIFNEGEYQRNLPFHTLTFTNVFPFNENRSGSYYSKYYNKLVHLTVYVDSDDKIENTAICLSKISVFEEIMSLRMDTWVNYYDDIRKLVKMPNLKNITLEYDEYLSEEKQKEYAETFCEHGIDSSTWHRLYS